MTDAILPASHRYLWHDGARHIDSPKGGDAFATLIGPAKELAEMYLTQELRDAFVSAMRPGGPGFVSMHGFLGPDEPESLTRPFPYDLRGFLLIGTIEALGYSFLSYLEEVGDGHLVERGDMGTDGAILRRPYRPELIGWVGSRRLDVIPLVDLLGEMEPALTDILRRPLYRFPSPPDFNYHGGKTIISEPRPILTAGHDGEPEIVLTPDVIPIGVEAFRAIEMLYKRFVQPLTRHIEIGRGTIVLLDNCRCLNAEPFSSGRKRPSRVYGRRSLDDLRRSWYATDDRCYRRFRTTEIVLH